MAVEVIAGVIVVDWRKCICRDASGEGRGVQWWLLVAWMYGRDASGEGRGMQWRKCMVVVDGCGVEVRLGWADNFSNYTLFKYHQIT